MFIRRSSAPFDDGERFSVLLRASSVSSSYNPRYLSPERARGVPPESLPPESSSLLLFLSPLPSRESEQAFGDPGGGSANTRPDEGDPSEFFIKIASCPRSRSPYPVPPGIARREKRSASLRAPRCARGKKKKYYSPSATFAYAEWPYCLPRGLDAIHGVIVVFLNAVATVRIFGSNIISSGATPAFIGKGSGTIPADSSFRGERIRLAFFIKRHHHHGPPYRPINRARCRKAAFTLFQANRIDDAPALTHSGRLNHFQFELSIMIGTRACRLRGMWCKK